MRNGFYLGLTLPLLLALAVNAYGLTTFGKSQNTPNQQPNPPPPVNRGRVCQFEKDCTAIANTSCVPDPHEPKATRCLCGDNNPPDNGNCKAKHKRLNHACMASEECIEGTECVPYKKEQGNRDAEKICKCSEGFTEVDFSCSGAVRLSDIPLFTIIVTLLTAVASSTY